MSEDLTTYMKEAGIKVNYLHSEIKTLERIEIIRIYVWVRMMSLLALTYCERY